MNIDELASIAEIIGGMAVVFSLIYLAIQVRESSKQAKLDSAVSLNHLINEAFDPIYNNDRNIHIWTTGLSDPSSLSEQDMAIYSLFMARLVNVLLTAFLHNDQDLLEAEAANRYAGSLKSILDAPGGQYWLQTMGGNDQLSDRSREFLAKTDYAQDFLTYGSNRQPDK